MISICHRHARAFFGAKYKPSFSTCILLPLFWPRESPCPLLKMRTRQNHNGPCLPVFSFPPITSPSSSPKWRCLSDTRHPLAPLTDSIVCELSASIPHAAYCMKFVDTCTILACNSWTCIGSSCLHWRGSPCQDSDKAQMIARIVPEQSPTKRRLPLHPNPFVCGWFVCMGDLCCGTRAKSQ